MTINLSADLTSRCWQAAAERLGITPDVVVEQAFARSSCRRLRNL